MARIGRLLLRLAPALVWMGVIALLSGDRFAAERTESMLLPVLRRALPGASGDTILALHRVFRKMAHVVEYGILALLWRGALRKGSGAGPVSAHPAVLAALVAGLYALADEARQSLAVDRSPSLGDVAVDVAGAVLALMATGTEPVASSRSLACLRRIARATAVLLAALSLVALAVDWSLGLTAWDLGLAALGLTLVALGLSRRPAWRRGS